MRNFAGASLAWLAHFFAKPSLPPHAGGVVDEVDIRRVIAYVEMRVCEGIAVRPAVENAAADEEVASPIDTKPLNVFGQRVRELSADGGRGAIAVARGMTQAGLRAVAFLSGDELRDSYAALTEAAAGHLPLIVYAGLDNAKTNGMSSGQANLCAVSDCGAFVIVPPTPQAALDYAIVARRIAEAALIPGVIALAESGTASVTRATDDLLREYLGGADDVMDCPTAAQFSLFAGKRRRVPKWFDADRPVARGAAITADARLTVAAGQRIFFQNALTEIAREAFTAWQKATGRELSFTSSYNIADAEIVIVALGKTIQTAQAAAVALEKNSAKKIGVLGIHWLRPFPVEEVRAALSGKARVIVLCEPDASLSAEPPFMREIKAAIGGAGQWTAGMVDGAFVQAEDVAALVLQTFQPNCPEQVWLGVNDREAGGLPKRDALVQATRNDYPELATSLLAAVSDSAPMEANADAPSSAGVLPKRVREVAADDKTYAGLARVWGEVIQPRQEVASHHSHLSPEPLSTLRAAPACSAACASGAAGALPLPLLDVDKCTACGDCWTACPDSAIGVSAIGIQEILDAAQQAVGHTDALGATLKRGHKQIAAALGKKLAGAGAVTLSADDFAAAYHTAAPKLRIPEGDEDAYEKAFSQTTETATRLALRVTDTLYQTAAAEAKGSGAVFALAINPAACTGCGICVSVCDENALVAEPRTTEMVASARQQWAAWEALPDTAGSVISRAAQPEILGEMAALLLSRHCALAQVTTGEDTPGCGERLSLRLLTAVTEYQKQYRMRDWAAQVLTLAERLRDDVDARLSGTLAAVELTDLAGALRETNGRQVDVAGVGAELEAAGKLGRVERSALLSRVELASDLARLHRTLIAGASGLGRSRFGVLMAGATTSAWAARFPFHPYAAPLQIDLSDSGADLARGIATGLIAEHIDGVRCTRQAELLLANPANLADELTALAVLDWTDLTAEEQAAAPALLLVVNDQTIRERGFGALSRLLTTDLPIKIILLDGRDVGAVSAEASLVALAHRRAYVLTTSAAYPDHLASGFGAALSYAGAALIHLHTPQPAVHGFAPNETFLQMQGAVAARVQPLLRYDPAGEGVFGRRISLVENPAPDALEAGEAVIDWAFSQTRYRYFFTPLEDDQPRVSIADCLANAELDLTGKYAAYTVDEKSYAVAATLLDAARERGQVWQVYRELAGEASPFVDRARAAVQEEIEAQQAASVDALKADYEAQLQALRVDVDGKLAQRLRERLRVLAGVQR